jgi:hypothetical protein
MREKASFDTWSKYFNENSENRNVEKNQERNENF